MVSKEGKREKVELKAYACFRFVTSEKQSYFNNVLSVVFMMTFDVFFK